jgi:hypothetical protein
MQMQLDCAPSCTGTTMPLLPTTNTISAVACICLALHFLACFGVFWVAGWALPVLGCFGVFWVAGWALPVLGCFGVFWVAGWALPVLARKQQIYNHPFQAAQLLYAHVTRFYSVSSIP